jgi:hypothetical protein
VFVPSRDGVKYIEMYLNTNILEGLKYNYKYFLNINVFKYEYIEKYFKYFKKKIMSHPDMGSNTLKCI